MPCPWSPQLPRWARAPPPSWTGCCPLPGQAKVPAGVACVRNTLSRLCRLVSTVQGAAGWKICEQPDVHGWEEFACHAISLKYTFQHLCLDLLMAYLVKDVGLVFDSSSVLSNLTMLGACSPASKKRNTPGHSIVIIIKRGWGRRGVVQRNRQKEFVGVGSFHFSEVLSFFRTSQTTDGSFCSWFSGSWFLHWAQGCSAPGLCSCWKVRICWITCAERRSC